MSEKQQIELENIPQKHPTVSGHRVYQYLYWGDPSLKSFKFRYVLSVDSPSIPAKDLILILKSNPQFFWLRRQIKYKYKKKR